MLWWTQRLDVPTDTFNIDKALDPEFKEFYCKRQNPQLLSMSDRKSLQKAHFSKIIIIGY